LDAEMHADVVPILGLLNKVARALEVDLDLVHPEADEHLAVAVGNPSELPERLHEIVAVRAGRFGGLFCVGLFEGRSGCRFWRHLGGSLFRCRLGARLIRDRGFAVAVTTSGEQQYRSGRGDLSLHDSSSSSM